MAPAKHVVTLQRFPPSQLSQAKGTTADEKASRRAASRRGQARVQSFVFPVNAENVDIRMGRETVDVALWNSRTVSRPGNYTPVEITLTGLMLPDPKCTPESTPWLNVPRGLLQDPWTVVQMLRDWQKAEGSHQRTSPLRLTIADINGMMMWVTMTQCDAQARGGEPGAAYLDCTFREIVDLPELKAKRVNPNKDKRVLVTKKNDTLITVLKRKYGTVTPKVVAAIYKMNKAKIGPNKTKKLPAGIRINFPATKPT